MFQGPAKRSRRFDARSNRRSKKQRQLFHSRRFALEALEPRQMLCVTHTGFSGSPPFPLDDMGQVQDTLPPGLVIARAAVQKHLPHTQPTYFIGDPAAAENLGAEATAAATTVLSYPLTAIPLLHSNPSATVKLYLDFDGHFEPVWGGSTNVTTPVYDNDGEPTTFNDTELGFIYMAWAKVAEDFAPFNIDVTLEEPEVLKSADINAANGIALRVAIGGSSRDWTGGDYGGIAHFDNFTNSIANVVYVFPAGAGDGTYYGDVASHEAGHGFGLSHQSSYDQNGVKTNEYNQGDGTWSPIMGGTYIPITTWYNGTSSAGPTVYQDDMAMLARPVNGFGFRADDHQNDRGSATALAENAGIWTGSGIIATNTDVDFFSFTTGASETGTDTYRIDLDVAELGPNLHAIVGLYDAAGALLATANPAASVGASIAAVLATGSMYYVSVTKTSDYGRVGAYSLNISAPPAGIIVIAPQWLVTREDGTMTSFTVALDTQPTADVTIPVSSSNVGEATVSASNLLFTPADWNVPQTVTVTGVDDSSRDNDAPYSIALGSIIGADSEYSGLDPADVAAMNLDDDYSGFVYWTAGGSVIKRSSLDGTDAQTILDLEGVSARFVAVDPAAGKVYWTDSLGGRIQRANLNGSNVETIVSGLGGGPRGIAIDSTTGRIYWANAQKIQRANLDGSGVEDLVTGGLSGVQQLVLDVSAGKMYWADPIANSISRANLDGSSIQVLWSGVDPAGIALDTTAGKLYWADAGTDEILWSDLDGSNVEELIDLRSYLQNSRVLSLAIDAANGKIYFSDRDNKSVYRANLDGSGVVPVVFDSTGGIQGIALLHPSITVTPSAGLFTSESGGSATFQVALTTPLQADVTIPLTTGNPLEGAVATASVTFTPANWNTPQTVTINGVDDSVLDGNMAYTVLLGNATSTDPDYDGVDPRDVSVTNVDNEVKFYVVNDATTNISYRYAADGTPRGNSSLNAGNASPRGVASAILGDKSWVIDANRNVYVYNNASGGLLGSWTAGSLANNATPEGIATNGTDVWIVDNKSDKVFRYTGAASRLSGSQIAASSFNLNSGNSNPKDIVTDGASLWVVDDGNKTDKVFKYSPTGGLLGSWTIDTANKAPTGITIDPANVSHIWIVDSGTDRVYQYNAAATRTSGAQPAALTFALAAGNTNPQGIADPPAPGSVAEVASLQAEVPRNWVASLSGQSANGAREQIPDTTHRRQAMPLAAAFAREQAFEWLASKPNNMQSQRATRFASAIQHDKVEPIEFTAHDSAMLELALDRMSAIVL